MFPIKLTKTYSIIRETEEAIILDSAGGSKLVMLPKDLLQEYILLYDSGKVDSSLKDIRDIGKESSKWANHLHGFEGQIKAVLSWYLNNRKNNQHLINLKGWTSWLDEEQAKKTDPTTIFDFIKTEEGLLKTITAFNSGKTEHHLLMKNLIYGSTYMVYDITTKQFAPSKFAAFKNMTVELYQRILNDEFTSSRFDGGVTRKKIIQVTGKEYEESEALFQELNKWGTELFGASFSKISRNKFKFRTISSKQVSKPNPQRPPTTPLPKPFLLLAGISGTGKTRFVREQAKANNPEDPDKALDETYCLVSVRPDWHEPSDILGYTSRINDEAEYIVTDVLKFIVKAWKELFNAGISFDGKKFKGTEQQLNSIRPFWLCLDEMNLAPVEQYFADYLSILETRKWEWTKDGKEFTYSCDSLLKPALLSDFSDEKDFQLQNHIGAYEAVELWEHFKKHGISIPFNLIVAGTVNMDETTHGFSRKVIDRALSFDFGEFFPNDFDAYFEPETKTKTFSYSIHSEARGLKGQFGTADPDGQQTIQFLKAINEVLEDTPFQLAYRALNELLLSSFSQQPIDEIELQAVWDDFLMQKVLPRIEGDLDKLSKVNTEQNILEALQDVLKRKKEDASEGFMPSLWRLWDKERPDLHRETMNGETQRITCRSKAKLAWMSNKLENGFTSFWP